MPTKLTARNISLNDRVRAYRFQGRAYCRKHLHESSMHATFPREKMERDRRECAACRRATERVLEIRRLLGLGLSKDHST